MTMMMVIVMIGGWGSNGPTSRRRKHANRRVVWSGILGAIMVMVVPILISPSCFSYVSFAWFPCLIGWVRPGIHQTTNHDDHGAYDDGGHNGNGDDDDGGHHGNGDDDGDGKGDGRPWSQSGVWSGTSGAIMVMVIPILISSLFSLCALWVGSTRDPPNHQS